MMSLAAGAAATDYFPGNEFIASELGAPKNLHPVKNRSINLNRVLRSCYE